MLKFTSLTIDNFGPYEGVQTIDFGSGDGVTLIWGDNGHGKTTLLSFRHTEGRESRQRWKTANLRASNTSGASLTTKSALS